VNTNSWAIDEKGRRHSRSASMCEARTYPLSFRVLNLTKGPLRARGPLETGDQGLIRRNGGCPRSRWEGFVNHRFLVHGIDIRLQGAERFPALPSCGGRANYDRVSLPQDVERTKRGKLTLVHRMQAVCGCGTAKGP
jgi:hypothetical protein